MSSALPMATLVAVIVGVRRGRDGRGGFPAVVALVLVLSLLSGLLSWHYVPLANRVARQKAYDLLRRSLGPQPPTVLELSRKPLAPGLDGMRPSELLRRWQDDVRTSHSGDARWRRSGIAIHARLASSVAPLMMAIGGWAVVRRRVVAGKAATAIIGGALLAQYQLGSGTFLTLAKSCDLPYWLPMWVAVLTPGALAVVLHRAGRQGPEDDVDAVTMSGRAL